MIVPRHKVCDFCGEEVGINKRYFKIKSKDYLVGYAGGCSDNRTHHICEDCMYRIASAVENMEFAKWVTNMIFDNQVEDFDFEMFSELACRKLEKMGLVEKTENEWIKKGGAE